MKYNDHRNFIVTHAVGDYFSVRSIITFSTGQSAVITPLTIVDDDIVEPTEAFGVMIIILSDDLILGDASNATITIVDNDSKVH